MRDAQALCQTCGLCCDGTLFDTVPLHDDEVATATRLKLHLVQRAGSHALRQPCAAFSARRCAVYVERPAVCRQFHCALLGAYDEDSVSLEDAQDIVREAHARIGAIPANTDRLKRWLSLHFVRAAQ